MMNMIKCTALLAFLAKLATASLTLSGNEASILIRRHLEDANAYFQYDLSEFSLRFDRCQYVKMYDDEMAGDEESSSPLVVKHFAIFRLCPSDECDTCAGTFGRYVTEVEEYLERTVEEQKAGFEYMCENCEQRCDEDDDYCSGCGKLCYQDENLESLGFVDAADYVQCQQLQMDNEDDSLQLYIGPRCSKDGSKVLIGLFSDEDCFDPYTEADPEDYLGFNISYHLLSHTNYDDGSYCLSCKENEADENEQDKEDTDDANEMCEDIYNTAAKCESNYGLGGFIQTAREDEYYENQVENEFMVCNFIESLLWNSYTETGDINIEGDLDVIHRDMTKLQKIALTFLSISIIGLLAAVYYIQKRIGVSFPKVQLSFQGDAQFT